MAIHKDVPNIEVTVCLAELPLREDDAADGFEHNGGDVPTAVKRIKWVNNIEYDIEIDVLMDKYGLDEELDQVLVAYVLIDGVLVYEGVIPTERNIWGEPVNQWVGCVIRGKLVRIGSEQCSRRFIFAVPYTGTCVLCSFNCVSVADKSDKGIPI